MSIASALAAIRTSTPDPLTEVLRTLPFNEPEPTPGAEWTRLQEVLGLATAPGQLLMTAIDPIKDNRNAPRTVADAAWADIEALSKRGWGAFFGLSKVPDDWVQVRGNRGTSTTCLPRRFVGVDFDLDFGTHAASSITLDMAVEAIRTFPARPVAVVFSGGGLHAYYRAAGNLNAETLAWLGDRINGWFGRATDLNTWDSKPTVDIARVLRIPGTVNAKSGEPVWVRLVWADEHAAPITRAMAEQWPTFTEAKRAVVGSPPPRVKRDVPKVRRVHDDDTPPWEAFNQSLNDHDSFGCFLESLGADVAGTKVRMPGDPALNDNLSYSANIRDSADGTIMLLTIHGTTTCGWWASGGNRSTFTAFDLLARTFGGDRSAAARYVNRAVLPDVEGWLHDFSWTPGDDMPDTVERRSSSTVVSTMPAAEPVPVTEVEPRRDVETPVTEPAPVAEAKPRREVKTTVTKPRDETCIECGGRRLLGTAGHWSCPNCDDF